MKARVPYNAKMTKKEEKLLREYTKEVFRKKYLGFERRIFKAMAYALNRNYGFGKNRIKTVLVEAERIADEYGTDEIFWDHLDRVCIDEIGIDFVREKLDENGKVMYDYDDDTKVFESEPIKRRTSCQFVTLLMSHQMYFLDLRKCPITRPPTTNRERKEVHPMDDITFNVFYATKTEADRYLKLSRTSNNQIEREIARQRYSVLYQLVFDSGLTDEYEAWEWNEEEEEE